MSEFGREFDRAQARYDAMSPDEDDEPEETCWECGEMFEPKRPSQKVCQKCLDGDEPYSTP